MLVPSIVNLELTNQCNLECVFCDHASLRKTMHLGQMDDKVLDLLLQSIKDYNVYELGLVGLGEPLLDCILEKHLETISKYKSIFTRISLNSNATLMDDNKAKLILNSPINLVTFSLNATNRDSYQSLMGQDIFNKTVTNIKQFIKQRKSHNREDLNVSIQFMSSELNEEREMQNLFKEYIDEKVIVYNRYVYYKTAVEDRGKGKVNVNHADFGNRHPCWSMYSRVYVDIEGNVYPCTIGNDSYRVAYQLCIGNIKHQSLISIFNNERMQKARLDAESGRLPFPECNVCTLWELFPNNFEFISGKWIYKEREAMRRKELNRND